MIGDVAFGQPVQIGAGGGGGQVGACERLEDGPQALDGAVAGGPMTTYENPS